jgi:hypothetical protein
MTWKGRKRRMKENLLLTTRQTSDTFRILKEIYSKRNKNFFK